MGIRDSTLGARLQDKEPADMSRPDAYDKEWRKTEWQSHGKNVALLSKIKLDHPDVNHIRILLTGPVGAGKSSLVNSITNVMQDRLTYNALVGNSTGQSFTVKYKTHFIRSCIGVCSFVINDLMGIEENEAGIHPDDIISALSGRIPDGYIFNPGCPLKENMQGYKRSPTLDDRVHCLVSVVSCNTISLMTENVLEQMKKIRNAASKLDIPQVVVMTMPDIACPLVAEDLKMIYKSKTIQTKMEECSNKLGVPLNCILPVKNYSDEVTMDHDVSSLVLVAMAQICNFANDFLWNLQKSPSDLNMPEDLDMSAGNLFAILGLLAVFGGVYFFWYHAFIFILLFFCIICCNKYLNGRDQRPPAKN